MKHHLLALFLLLLTPMGATASPVDSITALRRALEACPSRGMRAPTTAAQGRWHIKTADRATYLFATADGRFLLAAADDGLPPLLAYGTDAKGGMPPPVRAFVDAMRSLPPCTGSPVVPPHPVAPLLGDMVRHQKDPFNRHCPYYLDDDSILSAERCVVGCVATAAEEILTYHGRDITLRDTLHGWSTDHYSIPDILPGTNFAVSSIRPRYDGTYSDSEADAVAHLSYALGVASHMNWGTGESGTNIRRLVAPLRQAMGMGYVHHADSYRYRPEDWQALLYHELSAARPVLYAAYTMQMAGHAFVIDGIDSEGFVHVNWGYGGNYDGYFRLDLLNFYEPKWDLTEQGAETGFMCNHEALLICPDSVAPAPIDTIHRTGRELAVESLATEQAPERGRYTRLLITLRNTSDLPLTTPLEIFTNLPTDTALFEQADYIGLTGVTLAPGERRTIPAVVRFSGLGERHLRLSPDDETILFDSLVCILSTPSPRLSYDAPLLSFPGDSILQIVQTIRNAPEAGRSGQNVVYQIIEGTDLASPEGTSHTRRLFLAPGTTQCDTVRFHALVPGRTYTLIVRDQWPVVHQVTFVQGRDPATGITVPTAGIPGNENPSPRFTPSGLRIADPSAYSGVSIGRSGKVYHRNR